MNFFSKNRFVFWLLIFLAGINLSTFITLVVMFSKQPATNQPSTENPGNAFSKSLSLSAAQSVKVETILADYRNLTGPIISDIRDHRIQILEELAKDKPDKTVMDSYIEKITLLQEQMQNASVNQYLALKQICTPLQCQKLSTLYYELYGCKGQEESKNKGKMRRYRGGRNQ